MRRSVQQMTGTINSIKKWKGGFFFIEGDDGVRYYGHQRDVVDGRKKITYKNGRYTLWDVCAYQGNRVEFDITAADPGGDCPKAINIVLDKVADPDFVRKAERRAQERANRKAHERNRQLQEERERKAEIKRRNRELEETIASHGYAVQEYIGSEWKNIYDEDDQILHAESIEQGRNIISDIRKNSPGLYRLRKAKLYRNYGTKRVIVRIEA